MVLGDLIFRIFGGLGSGGSNFQIPLGVWVGVVAFSIGSQRHSRDSDPCSILGGFRV